jgi:hypothetical protein
MDTLRNMAGRLDWVWVDCFSKMPLTADVYNEIQELGYKICIVSPELQGQEEKIEIYAEQLRLACSVYDAICGKFYNRIRWNVSYDM